MTNPFSSYGYERFREFAINNFTHLALIDDQGSEITRIDLSSDSRVTQTPSATSNPLVYRLEVDGGDSDIPNPVTVALTELYETDTATQSVGSDTMLDARLEAPNDTVVIEHEQSIPK